MYIYPKNYEIRYNSNFVFHYVSPLLYKFHKHDYNKIVSLPCKAIYMALHGNAKPPLLLTDIIVTARNHHKLYELKDY